MFLIGLLIAIGAVFLVMNWWSEGMIEASEAVILVVVYGGLAVGLFNAHSLWQVILALAPMAGAIAFTYYSFRLGGMRAIYKQRCNEYMLAIQSDPTNRAAREYLATTLYTMGELDRAIDEIEVAVNMGAELECQYNLTKWQKERYMRDSANPFCRWCHTENQQGAKVCVKCGADLPFKNSLNHWITNGKTAVSRYYLLLTAGVALLAVSLLWLPVYLALIPLGFVVLAVMGWSLISSARS